MAVELDDITVGSGEHVAHFYEDDSDFARTIGARLTAALRDGSVGVVIATEAHRRALEAELEGAGLASAAGSPGGTLIFLDAAATLAGFFDAGQVNHEDFRQIVGPVMRQAAGTGRPVWAYGEMVAILWEAGDVLAAIELEKAWNKLAHELPFALVCGYRSESVQGGDHADALGEVCQLHSSVWHGQPGMAGDANPERVEVSARFEAERTSARDARHFVTDALEGWGYDETLLADAQLVVTELATNAIVHGQSPFALQIQPHGHGLRVTIADSSPVRPTLQDAGPLAHSGRGLQLVDALAVEWGVELAADGKTVWAELEG